MKYNHFFSTKPASKPGLLMWKSNVFPSRYFKRGLHCSLNRFFRAAKDLELFDTLETLSTQAFLTQKVLLRGAISSPRSMLLELSPRCLCKSSKTLSADVAFKLLSKRRMVNTAQTYKVHTWAKGHNRDGFTITAGHLSKKYFDF